MITQYEIRQELHTASPLIGENRLILGPFDTKEEAISEALKLPLQHLFVLEKIYASIDDLKNHFWASVRFIATDRG